MGQVASSRKVKGNENDFSLRESNRLTGQLPALPANFSLSFMGQCFAQRRNYWL